MPPITITLEEQFFEDILVTALEGGSNYWIKSVLGHNPENVRRSSGVPYSVWLSEAIIKGGKIDFVTDDGEEETLTFKDFHSGVKVWADKHPNTIASAISVENNKVTPDPSNIDASDADAILQYALFGKLVYG